MFFQKGVVDHWELIPLVLLVARIFLGDSSFAFNGNQVGMRDKALLLLFERIYTRRD